MKQTVIFALIALLICGCSQSISDTGLNIQNQGSTTKTEPTRATSELLKTYGISYGPFRGFQNPASGPYPTSQEIANDLKEIKRSTDRIRTYSVYGENSLILEEAQKLGISVLPGAWIGREKFANSVEIDALISAIKKYNFKQVIVSSEALLRDDIKVAELISYIKQVREATGVKVGVAELWAIWIKYPELIKECDFVVVHIYGYWDNQPIETATQYVLKRFHEIQTLTGDKQVIIGETGWPYAGPTNGKAVASQANQERFISEFVSSAQKENIPYYLFEAFDEDWKCLQEFGVGNHWGLPFLSRTYEFTQPQVNQFPFVVYDEAKIVSSFSPSGWMGNHSLIKIKPDCKNNPHSGTNCIQIDYKSPGIFADWCGVYWQYPEDNWGDMKGYKLNGAKQLTFWARGATGNETAEFKIGGINSPGKPYSDSISLRTTGEVLLSKEWKKYTINLSGSKLDCVISGFCWVVNNFPSKNNTIYLDDIQFE